MRKYFIILFLLIASILFLPTVINAANQYIKDGATGTYATTGCDTWEDARACDDLPASLIRGTTYYIADGTYGRHTFQDPCLDTPTPGCDATDMKQNIMVRPYSPLPM
jgi:hypothetical protein